MRLSAVRPVGELVPVFPSRVAYRWPDGYRATWMDSGTAALALALRSVISSRGDDERHVIVPAYTCPDVISAVLWAGGVPLIVDTRAESPWIDESAVAADLDGSIAAIVAPHFLGVPHPMGPLAEICERSGAVLVEDSAQLGATSPAFSPAADFVILSFGRGKPVPAGGGVLLYREPLSGQITDLVERLPRQQTSALGWRVRTLLKNAGMTRKGFAIAKGIPWLQVGETTFKNLDTPRVLEGEGTKLAEAVLADWSRIDVQVEHHLSKILHNAGCGGLPEQLGWNGGYPLLRFPALAPDEDTRNRLASLLDRDGASPFYRVPLPAIDGVPSLDVDGRLTNAEAFARRLFTLPCHSGIGDEDLDRISRKISGLLMVTRARDN